MPMRQSVRQGTDSVWFMMQKSYNSCNSKNHDIKDLIWISVLESSHLCPLQVLNISNVHALLAYNTVQDSCWPFPGKLSTVVHIVSVAIWSMPSLLKHLSEFPSCNVVINMTKCSCLKTIIVIISESEWALLAKYVSTYEEFVVVTEAPQCNRKTATGQDT